MKTNLYAMFWLCKAAVPHMQPGSTVITTSSVQAFQPSPQLLDYATTKGGHRQLHQGAGATWPSGGSGRTRWRRGRCGPR